MRLIDRVVQMCGFDTKCWIDSGDKMDCPFCGRTFGIEWIDGEQIECLHCERKFDVFYGLIGVRKYRKRQVAKDGEVIVI